MHISTQTNVILLLVSFLASSFAQAERVKDLAQVAGLRNNQLVGYGLVTGLNGTGDQTTQTPFTVQSIKSMLSRFGVAIPPEQNLQLNNVAAVTLHATLPPFAKPGQTIDVTVSSMGNAKSLRGGSLLLSPLKGANNQIYAIAQGNLVVGGFGAEGNDGSSITVNIPSVGRIPNGATVERSVPTSFLEGTRLTLNLHRPDFTTTYRLAAAINRVVGKDTARPLDGGSVAVNLPRNPAQRVAFVSLVENVELEPGTAPARIVVNSRTGTVVIGSHVRVTPAAVAHGSLLVTITERTDVSQPNLLADGDTVATPRSAIEVTREQSRMFMFRPGVALNDIVRAVNQVGAAPGDLVAILEALREAGALRAELVII